MHVCLNVGKGFAAACSAGGGVLLLVVGLTFQYEIYLLLYLKAYEIYYNNSLSFKAIKHYWIKKKKTHYKNWIKIKSNVFKTNVEQKRIIIIFLVKGVFFSLIEPEKITQKIKW